MRKAVKAAISPMTTTTAPAARHAPTTASRRLTLMTPPRRAHAQPPRDPSRKTKLTHFAPASKRDGEAMGAGARERSENQANSDDTDRSALMRMTASAINGAMLIWRMLRHPFTASVA